LRQPQSPAARERASVSDIFDEIDEEVRREQFKKLWERYGNLFIALAVLVVIGVGGWQGYDYWRNKQAEQFGAQFTAAADLADKGKHAEAEKAFAEIAQKGTTGYRALAKLREAAEIEQRDPKAAVAAWKANDVVAMRKWVKMVHDDPDTPPSLRQRVDILTALVPESPKT
jgi:hypothetical protein